MYKGHPPFLDTRPGCAMHHALRMILMMEVTTTLAYSGGWALVRQHEH
jgi:hypothetical protein